MEEAVNDDAFPMYLLISLVTLTSNLYMEFTEKDSDRIEIHR